MANETLLDFNVKEEAEDTFLKFLKFLLKKYFENQNSSCIMDESEIYSPM